jgi:hypothetical protein
VGPHQIVEESILFRLSAHEQGVDEDLFEQVVSGPSRLTPSDELFCTATGFCKHFCGALQQGIKPLKGMRECGKV